MGIMALFLIAEIASINSRPVEARSAALELRAIIEAARSLAAANASSSTINGNASGATVAVTSENGHTVIHLYVGRPLTSGPLPEDPHVSPVVTDAEISVLSGIKVRPPFAILVSSSGYASLVSGYDVSARLPTSNTSCPAGGYTLSFRAGLHTEFHQLSCENTSLVVNSNK